MATHSHGAAFILLVCLASGLFLCGCGGDSSTGSEDSPQADSEPNDDTTDDDADHDPIADDDSTDDDTVDDDTFEDILPRSLPPDHIYLLDISDLDFPTQLLAASLQGLVAREKPEIYLLGMWPNDPPNIPGTDAFLELYKEKHGVTTTAASDVWELVDLFTDRFSGAVVYDPTLPETTNIATTISGLEDLLIVHPDLIDEAEAHGIMVVEDLRGRWTDKYAAINWGVEELLPQCLTSIVADLSEGTLGPRDYLIQHRVFTFRYKPIIGEIGALFDILSHFPENLAVMGYLASNGFEEGLGQYILSLSGAFLLPSDYAPNLSVHSGIQVQESAFDQPPITLPDLTPQQIGDSVFVSFAVSDGDNYQIPMHVMLNMWADPAHGQIPISWTIPGTIPTLAPGIAEYFYTNRTNNDRFMTLDGLGYVYGSLYPDREWYIEKTAQYHRRLDIDILWLFEPLVEIGFPLDGYLDRLAAAADLIGFVANYNRSFRTHDFTKDGYPILNTMINYGSTPVEVMVDVINEAIAEKQPGAPAYVFFGSSCWTTTPSDMLEALNHYAGNENVRPISVSQMLKLMVDFPPGW